MVFIKVCSVVLHVSLVGRLAYDYGSQVHICAHHIAIMDSSDHCSSFYSIHLIDDSSKLLPVV